jgi:hypothetical protein
VTDFIRAAGPAPTGRVQLLIEIAQDAKFERFALRAKTELIKMQKPT